MDENGLLLDIFETRYFGTTGFIVVLYKIFFHEITDKFKINFLLDYYKLLI